MVCCGFLLAKLHAVHCKKQKKKKKLRKPHGIEKDIVNVAGGSWCTIEIHHKM